MVDFDKMVENGKSCGVEYEFLDNSKLRKCICGELPKIYIKHENRNLSFRHASVRCAKCNKSVSCVFDVSGKSSEFYKPKEIAINKMIEEWENGVDDFVEEVRNGCNISDIITEKKCPKCGKELTVSEEKQMYYCFDCKNGGNVFTYIMQTTGKNMKEAVEYLSK